ncbi:MAG: hypothetical protein KC468_37730, partial [Myxococcales bacterium]|nr:hypothetical protein [Myxococcales bacterium]
LPDGTAMLVGVSSRGTTCGEGGVYASVFPAMCWIGREFDIQWRESSNQCDGTCGCIDTPNILEGGCSVARPAGENRRPWLAVSLVIGYLGRRRRSRTPATDRSRHAARPR